MNVCFSLILWQILMEIKADYCGENKIPYGLEVHRNGQPILLCSRPNCFEKKYAECDDRALRKSCDENNTWVGGFDKAYGYHQPLYVQCCESEDLLKHSTPLYNAVAIRPGEYFEGEEQMDVTGDEVVSFDIITNLRLIRDPNTTIAYLMDVRRMHCNEFEPSSKRKRKINWP
uniref:WxxW domain-containing protein n=2 Tax=Ascaris TaxID=6251 RepID=A0A0M3I829_ASCLU